MIRECFKPYLFRTFLALKRVFLALKCVFLALKRTKDLLKADNFVVSCFEKYKTQPVLNFFEYQKYHVKIKFL